MTSVRIEVSTRTLYFATWKLKRAAQGYTSAHGERASARYYYPSLALTSSITFFITDTAYSAVRRCVLYLCYLEVVYS